MKLEVGLTVCNMSLGHLQIKYKILTLNRDSSLYNIISVIEIDRFMGCELYLNLKILFKKLVSYISITSCNLQINHLIPLAHTLTVVTTDSKIYLEIQIETF